MPWDLSPGNIARTIAVGPLTTGQTIYYFNKKVALPLVEKATKGVSTKIFGENELKSELEIASIREKVFEPTFEFLDPMFNAGTSSFGLVPEKVSDKLFLTE